MLVLLVLLVMLVLLALLATLGVCSPAGVSLAAAGVDALWQGVVQGGFHHVEADGLLVHLAARVPARHQWEKCKKKKKKRNNGSEQGRQDKKKRENKTKHHILI